MCLQQKWKHNAEFIFFFTNLDPIQIKDLICAPLVNESIPLYANFLPSRIIIPRPNTPSSLELWISIYVQSPSDVQCKNNGVQRNAEISLVSWFQLCMFRLVSGFPRGGSNNSWTHRRHHFRKVSSSFAPETTDRTSGNKYRQPEMER